MSDIIGKSVFLVIGASSDIGRTFILNLDKQHKGCIVIAQYNSSKVLLDNLREELVAIELISIKCDLSQPDEVLELISYVKEKYVAPTHILHLAAGKFEYMRMRNFDWNAVTRELEIEVHSFAEVAKAFLPQMVKNKFGKVVVMLTAYTLGVPPKFMSNYIIAKYALLGLTKSLASEYSGKGININGISPNMVETKFLSNLDEHSIELNAMNSAMRRNMRVEEVVAGINFLLSDEASYVNGLNLNMTGGDVM